MAAGGALEVVGRLVASPPFLVEWHVLVDEPPHLRLEALDQPLVSAQDPDPPAHPDGVVQPQLHR